MLILIPVRPSSISISSLGTYIAMIRKLISVFGGSVPTPEEQLDDTTINDGTRKRKEKKGKERKKRDKVGKTQRRNPRRGVGKSSSVFTNAKITDFKIKKKRLQLNDANETEEPNTSIVVHTEIELDMWERQQIESIKELNVPNAFKKYNVPVSNRLKEMTLDFNRSLLDVQKQLKSPRETHISDSVVFKEHLQPLPALPQSLSLSQTRSQSRRQLRPRSRPPPPPPPPDTPPDTPPPPPPYETQLYLPSVEDML